MTPCTAIPWWPCLFDQDQSTARQLPINSCGRFMTGRSHSLWTFPNHGPSAPSQTRPNPQHPGFVLSSLPTITGREDALHDAIMSTNRVPHQLGKSEALRDAPVSLIFSVE